LNRVIGFGGLAVYTSPYANKSRQASSAKFTGQWVSSRWWGCVEFLIIFLFIVTMFVHFW